MNPAADRVAFRRNDCGNSPACTSLRLGWRAVKGVAGYNVSLSFALIALQ